MDFGKYIRQIRIAKELSLREAGELARVSSSYLCQIETGQKGPPSPDILKKLSTAYGVDYNDLLRAAGHLPQINLVMSIDDLLIENILKVPVYNKVGIENGKVKLEREYVISYEFIKADIHSKSKFFCMLVPDDSMEGAQIKKDSILLIEKTNQLKNKDIGLFILDNNILLRRYFLKDHSLILLPENPNYDPEVISENKSLTIIGKVKRIITDSH